MCEISKTLKLCTCSDKIDKSKPYWRLARKTVKQADIEVIMGEYMPSYSFSDVGFVQTGEWLLSLLNDRWCFNLKQEKKALMQLLLTGKRRVKMAPDDITSRAS